MEVAPGAVSESTLFSIHTLCMQSNAFSWGSHSYHPSSFSRASPPNFHWHFHCVIYSCLKFHIPKTELKSSLVNTYFCCLFFFSMCEILSNHVSQNILCLQKQYQVLARKSSQNNRIIGSHCSLDNDVKRAMPLCWWFYLKLWFTKVTRVSWAGDTNLKCRLALAGCIA